MLKSGLYAYHDHLQATNKFYLAAVLLSDPVIDAARRELRRLSDVLVDAAELRSALVAEVLKREVTEGDKAESARKKVQRSAGKALRSARATEKPAGDQQTPQTTPSTPSTDA
jgi:hypothetical protein